MDETSFSDPEVISSIKERFVPVRVDSDQRPDINSRYNMGGWPTVAFLTPVGDLIAGGTYMSPQHLKGALERVSESYSKEKQQISDRADEVRSRRSDSTSQTCAKQEVTESIVESVLMSVSDAYDSECGGFGNEPKFPVVSALELLLNVYRCDGDVSYRAMVEHTLDGMAGGGLFDREEGGFFRYSTTRDWSVPHFEKMLPDNVGLLRLYAHSSLVTGRQEHAIFAARTADYLRASLYDEASGAFCGSQDADEAYYALPVNGRRALKPPTVDGVLYAGLNGMLISAYLDASWMLDKPDLASTALRTMEYLLERCREGPLRHSYTADADQGIPALLVDYAQVVTALADAYAHTSDARYLEEAQRLASEMVDLFWDEQGHGFFDIQEDSGALGGLRFRNKPLVDNVVASEALLGLFAYTSRETYREMAGKALGFFVPLYTGYGEAAAGYALAVRRFLEPPVEVTVVGVRANSDAQGLLRAAVTMPHAHVAIRLMDAGDEERLAEAGYWYGGAAQAYVCLKTICLAPVDDPEALHRTLAEFVESQSGGIQSILRSI